MFDSPEELLRKIRLGEDTSLELKSVSFRGQKVTEPARDDLGDEIAAMANTLDGVLVLGVDDRTREIVGISTDRLELVERFVYEVCNDSIRPPVPFVRFVWSFPTVLESPGRSSGSRSPAACSCTRAGADTSTGREARNAGCRRSCWPVSSSSGARHG